MIKNRISERYPVFLLTVIPTAVELVIPTIEPVPAFSVGEESLLICYAVEVLLVWDRNSLPAGQAGSLRSE
ncbi:hypothetical protein DN748_08390 [Sinomicrobium soli]|nr:hypothetical protein DN748_08390 [Sinomicrobium sp. N-1-3-6]